MEIKIVLGSKFENIIAKTIMSSGIMIAITERAFSPFLACSEAASTRALPSPAGNVAIFGLFGFSGFAITSISSKFFFGNNSASALPRSDLPVPGSPISITCRL